ncbi:DUF4912 domain-containing protein [Spirochaeta lutea]|uniref:DUF4912 domain-containing protein n=1 Tax=Spirochaeta lutea TaxID=1480694 RepID=UPI00068BFB67|nr:DUF4912 domain-containing protein [Spirochaeta lutea]
MTKDTIRKLSADDLRKLVELLDLDIDDELLILDSDELRLQVEELIFEELEDTRIEREQNSTLPVQYQDKRYSTIEDIFGTDRPIDFGSFEFPEQYNVTRIVCMLRDPAWVFAYWDISLHDRNVMMEEPSFQEVKLLMEEVQGGESEEREAIIVEIPIQLNDSKWYINIPRRGTHYRVSLVAVFSNKNEVLAKSGVFTVPSGSISRQLDIIESFETEALLALSGLENLGVSTYEGIPQRILRHINVND